MLAAPPSKAESLILSQSIFQAKTLLILCKQIQKICIKKQLAQKPYYLGTNKKLSHTKLAIFL
jgi:hypothetical protein